MKNALSLKFEVSGLVRLEEESQKSCNVICYKIRFESMMDFSLRSQIVCFYSRSAHDQQFPVDSLMFIYRNSPT